MMTIFSTAKRFDGLFDVIQRNAIRSWTLLRPTPEVILFGDDAGTSELCRELGILHVPEVASNEFGTPLISAMFEEAQRLAHHPVLCFVNADVMLLDDTMTAARRAQEWSRRFLMVSQRRDVDLVAPFDFGPGWQDRLGRLAHTEGRLMSEVWIDWFVFPRGQLTAIPDFAVGRSGYDNWLLWKAASDRVPLVDATAFVTLVHQRHDYSHAGGKAAVWEGTEARRQQAMIGHWSRLYSVAHADHMFTGDGEIAPAAGLKYRLARPRRAASHLLRFSRPLRRRLHGERATRRRPSRVP